METYKELLGAAIKFKNTAYINRVCTKSASKDSRSACPQYVFPDMCSSLHQLDFLRSRSPYSIYTKQGTPIRSRTFRVGHPATRSRAFGVGHPAIQSRAFGVGYSK